jgi:23S rRNA-/tRNA-specific pseudouridylate synthase
LGRWIGREILEVFSKEFQAFTADYYRETILAGRITVGGQTVTCEYKLRNGDHIVHKTVRREPPVLGEPLALVAVTDDFVVVNKPPSIPAHPCGAYRYNSLPFILAKDNGFVGLHTMHRLDRLTSGLVLLARTKASSITSVDGADLTLCAHCD